MKFPQANIFRITSICFAILFLGFMSASVTYADNKPAANFTCNVTQGYAPLSVKFNDTSTGAPTNWNWNFGDGNNSTLKNPVNVYSKPGKYTVNLTVSNANGTSSKLANITVTSFKWVTGYYIGYETSKLPPENIYWPGLTHIVMGAITVYPDGSLNTDFYIDPTNGPILAKKISTLAHQNNKKALLMLGGEGTDENISLAIKNHQSVFISNLVNAMNTYGYDGIDLDWEGENVDYNQFVSFAKALRKAAPNAILTVPVECINPNFKPVDPSIVELSKYMDQVNVMSYYPISVMTGYGRYSWFNSPLKGAKNNTPISIENSLSLYNAAGIPKNKLGMGIGLFAIGYTGSPIITGPDQETNATTNIIKEIDLSSIYGPNWVNYEKYLYWSDEADEPYLSLPSPGLSGARYISFENPQSITEKGNFTRDNGYGGIIIWNLNKGYVRNNSDPNFLMKAIQKGFLEQTVPRSNFTCNVTQGYAPLSVKFNDTSTGAPTNWNWNFGDGNNSTLKNPVNVYSKPGKYTVNLTVSNANGISSKLANITVTSFKWVTGYYIGYENLLSAGRHKNPFNFSIDIDFLRTFEIRFKSKITKR